MGAWDEGEVDRLVKTTRRNRAAHYSRPALGRRERRSRNRVGARHCLRWYVLQPIDAHDLFDEIGGAFNIAAPRRRLHGKWLVAAHREAKVRQNANDFG